MKLILLLFFIVSCQPKKSGELQFRPPGEEGVRTTTRHVPFSEIENLFARYSCIDCHDWVETERDLLSEGIINRNSPASSELYRVLKTKQMPPDGPYLTEDELNVVLDYIRSLK